MGYNIGLKKTTFGGTINFLDSQQVRYVRGGVTLDATEVAADGNGMKKLPAGTFIGKVENGKYAKYTAGGGITPTLILAEEVIFTTFTPTGGVAHADQVATAIDMARVITSRLPEAPDATVKANMPMITFV